MTHRITLTVNGVPHGVTVPARRLLSDALRHDLGLTGTHVGCEHGVCGCCTVLLDGEPVRSCLMLAVTAEGHEITTVEGLGEGGGLSPVQRAFRECHGLQCGFCTPGLLCVATALLRDVPRPSDEEIVEGISGNLCRCTGYQNIVAAIRRAADLIAEERAGGPTRSGANPVEDAGNGAGPVEAAGNGADPVEGAGNGASPAGNGAAPVEDAGNGADPAGGAPGGAGEAGA